MNALSWISLGWVCMVAAKSACDTREVIQSGKDCEVSLSDLLPSQLYIGSEEVSMKEYELQMYDDGDKDTPCYESAQEALNDAGITVVQSLECNQFYITDGHHTITAALNVNVSYPVQVKVIDSFCQKVMKAESFWSEMINLSYAFPYALNDDKDLSRLSAREMSKAVPKSVLGMTDWWYRSLAYLVKRFGDFHPLKDDKKKNVPFGKFFEGQCLKDLGVEQRENITREFVGEVATLFDDKDALDLQCQLNASFDSPERRSIEDIQKREMSCSN